MGWKRIVLGVKQVQNGKNNHPCSVLSGVQLGRHAVGGLLRDDPNNGCEETY